VATPVVTPVATVSCNPLVPMTINALAWSNAYASDPNNTTKWLTVDGVSCNSYSGVELVDVKNNVYIMTAKRIGTNQFGHPTPFSSGRTPQLSTGDILNVGNFQISPTLYYTLYKVTMQ
jgi:hypothetical protein